MLRLGFVGTGAITEAIVQGMQLSGGEAYAFHLSPRSEERSRALAAAFPNVTREESNEAVVAASDVVFLGVRPQHIAVLAGLPFREGQVVVTLLAGTPLARIRALTGPAARVVRVLPLPSIRHRSGPIVMTPADRARCQRLSERVAKRSAPDQAIGADGFPGSLCDAQSPPYRPPHAEGGP